MASDANSTTETVVTKYAALPKPTLPGNTYDQLSSQRRIAAYDMTSTAAFAYLEYNLSGLLLALPMFDHMRASFEFVYWKSLKYEIRVVCPPSGTCILQAATAFEGGFRGPGVGSSGYSCPGGVLFSTSERQVRGEIKWNANAMWRRVVDVVSDVAYETAWLRIAKTMDYEDCNDTVGSSLIIEVWAAFDGIEFSLPIMPAALHDDYEVIQQLRPNKTTAPVKNRLLNPLRAQSADDPDAYTTWFLTKGVKRPQSSSRLEAQSQQVQEAASRLLDGNSATETSASGGGATSTTTQGDDGIIDTVMSLAPLAMLLSKPDSNADAVRNRPLDIYRNQANRTAQPVRLGFKTGDYQAAGELPGDSTTNLAAIFSRKQLIVTDRLSNSPTPSWYNFSNVWHQPGLQDAPAYNNVSVQTAMAQAFGKVYWNAVTLYIVVEPSQLQAGRLIITVYYGPNPSSVDERVYRVVLDVDKPTCYALKVPWAREDIYAKQPTGQPSTWGLASEWRVGLQIDNLVPPTSSLPFALLRSFEGVRFFDPQYSGVVFESYTPPTAQGFDDFDEYVKYFDSRGGYRSRKNNELRAEAALLDSTEPIPVEVMKMNSGNWTCAGLEVTDVLDMCKLGTIMYQPQFPGGNTWMGVRCLVDWTDAGTFTWWTGNPGAATTASGTIDHPLDRLRMMFRYGCGGFNVDFIKVPPADGARKLMYVHASGDNVVAGSPLTVAADGDWSRIETRGFGVADWGIYPVLETSLPYYSPRPFMPMSRGFQSNVLARSVYDGDPSTEYFNIVVSVNDDFVLGSLEGPPRVQYT